MLRSLKSDTLPVMLGDPTSLVSLVECVANTHMLRDRFPLFEKEGISLDLMKLTVLELISKHQLQPQSSGPQPQFKPLL